MAVKAIARAGLLLTALLAPHSMAAPKSELWSFWSEHQPQSSFKVDHAIWQALLSRHVLLSDDGIHRVAYGEFDDTAKAKLREYLDAMSRLAPTQLNRDEQLAYWINLYNAQTTMKMTFGGYFLSGASVLFFLGMPLTQLLTISMMK